MQLRVKTLTGREIVIDSLSPDDKIATIKDSIEKKEGIPPSQQRLIFGGKQLSDAKSIAEASLKNDSVLHLVLALRGGMEVR